VEDQIKDFEDKIERLIKQNSRYLKRSEDTPIPVIKIESPLLNDKDEQHESEQKQEVEAAPQQV